jgi:hypothetical protein
MTMSMWRSGCAALLVLAACGSDPAPVDDGSRDLPFGPVAIPAHTEDLSRCVALTLHNTEELFVNEVELTTGPGFHHSNWLWVPDTVFPGPDGVFVCDERNYDQTAAGVLGGVFFAQSTQSEHEVQRFPDGVALKLPVGSKLVAQMHLLNNGDEPLELSPHIGFKSIAADTVQTKLASVSFEYHPLALPSQKQSRVTVECDLAPKHLELLGRMPDFRIYYALAHYHEWGTRLAIEAVTPDGTSTTIYSTEANVGDVLGGVVDPAFSMDGYTKVRLTCEYFNDTQQTLHYGNGNGEMCIFNAFSDSPYMWAGGAINNDDPGTPTNVDGVMSFTHACQVFALDNDKF